MPSDAAPGGPASPGATSVPACSLGRALASAGAAISSGVFCPPASNDIARATSFMPALGTGCQPPAIFATSPLIAAAAVGSSSEATSTVMSSTATLTTPASSFPISGRSPMAIRRLMSRPKKNTQPVLFSAANTALP